MAPVHLLHGLAVHCDKLFQRKSHGNMPVGLGSLTLNIRIITEATPMLTKLVTQLITTRRL
jgi:hypothetical protein